MLVLWLLVEKETHVASQRETPAPRSHRCRGVPAASLAREEGEPCGLSGDRWGGWPEITWSCR